MLMNLMHIKIIGLN